MPGPRQQNQNRNPSSRANAARSRSGGNRLATPQSVDQAIKSVCDIMRRGNCAGAMEYVPELTRLLFLRIRDEREQQDADRAAALGLPHRPALESPYRWRCTRRGPGRNPWRGRRRRAQRGWRQSAQLGRC